MHLGTPEPRGYRAPGRVGVQEAAWKISVRTDIPFNRICEDCRDMFPPKMALRFVVCASASSDSVVVVRGSKFRSYSAAARLKTGQSNRAQDLTVCKTELFDTAKTTPSHGKIHKL